MRLAIFGGTGRVGRELLRQALDQGHEVTMLARDPAKVTAREGLRVVQGDVRDQEAVAETVAGAEVVLSALGQRTLRHTTLCSDGVREIQEAMATHGVSRLLVVSAYGAADSRHRSVYVTLLWIGIRAAMQDKERMEALIKAGRTDWTIVRPGVIAGGAPKGHYHAGPDLRPSLFGHIPEGDVAAFMLAHLTTGTHARETVTLTP